MAQEPGSRKFAVIVAADVAGYTRLVSQAERETLVALRSHRAEFIEPLIADNRGRLAIRQATAC